MLPAEQALPSDLIRLSAGARLLGVAPSSLWRWMNRGKIQGYRIGNVWRVSRADVLTLVERSRVRPEVAAKKKREAEIAESLRVLDRAGIR